MKFNKHYNLQGAHAFLSPSKYHWVNYDDQKLIDTYRRHQAAVRGTRLHEFAKQAIDLGVKLPRSPKTLHLYVNDAIGYKMDTEVPLVYSENSFGTADTISFRGNMLRIHDLKTGESPVSMVQLEVYEALFCLEYKFKPSEINSELRIYQSDQVLVHTPEPERIMHLMDRIVVCDRLIQDMKEDE